MAGAVAHQRALGGPAFTAVQIYYSLVGREAEHEIIPPVDPDVGERGVDAVAAVAEARGVTLAQVALAWVLAQPGITSVIVGASSLEQLDDNLAAADLVLDDAELARLDAATALAPIYPAWWDPAMGIPAPNAPT